MKKRSPYHKVTKIIHLPFFSLYVYYMSPGGIEAKHFHEGIEMEYVLKGNSRTHKQGKFYFRKNHEIHEGINDSGDELVFVCMQIPAETSENTHYL